MSLSHLRKHNILGQCSTAKPYGFVSVQGDDYMDLPDRYTCTIDAETISGTAFASLPTTVALENLYMEP